jgi:hypothetical protein
VFCRGVGNVLVRQLEMFWGGNMKCFVLCRGVGNVLVGRHGMFLWETGSVLSRGRKCPGGEQEMF